MIMRFLKQKVVYNGFKANKVDDKEFITLYFINDEGDIEALNYVGNKEDLSLLKIGDFVDIYCKVYRMKDNYYKISGISIYKIERC